MKKYDKMEIRMNNKTSLSEIILIDNFDSFTYNLVNQLKPLVASIKIFRNDVSFDVISSELEQISERKVIVISPGPGCPDEAGVTLQLIEKYQNRIPILVICLGHQAIVQSFGGTIDAAKSIVHGKACEVLLFNGNTDLFGDLHSPFTAARYHSLAAVTIPEELEVVATADSEVMAVRHQRFKILGFQFHPESILTPHGGTLLKNALSWLIA